MKKIHHQIAGFLFLVFLIPVWVVMPHGAFANDPGNTSKEKIAALYLYNFLLFVDWPKSSIADTTAMKVVIYRNQRLYEAMKPMAGKKIKGKELIILALARPKQLEDFCHVLFVGDMEKSAVRKLLMKVAGKPVLTVSDREDFVDLGGMVTFKDPATIPEIERQRKRFAINLSAVKESGLQIRSRLLRMSDIFYDSEPVSPWKQ